MYTKLKFQRNILLVIKRLRGQRDEHGVERRRREQHGRLLAVDAVEPDDGVRGTRDDDAREGGVQLDAAGRHSVAQCGGVSKLQVVPIRRSLG